MKIREAIEFLWKEENKGYKYVSTDHYEGMSLWFTKKKPKTNKEVYYMTIFNDEMYPPENPIKGKHYANIKCRILRTEVKNDEKSSLYCVADVEPISKLPKWYKREEGYDDDFNEVNIEELCENEFWLPINEGTCYSKRNC